MYSQEKNEAKKHDLGGQNDHNKFSIYYQSL